MTWVTLWLTQGGDNLRHILTLADKGRQAIERNPGYEFTEVDKKQQVGYCAVHLAQRLQQSDR
ncbi:MAG: hypothetical protein KJO55_03310 [Gammaproteobacteria bacterium]|nr:hypothetical protein [Gammaproteobacteria bacterium]